VEKPKIREINKGFRANFIASLLLNCDLPVHVGYVWWEKMQRRPL